MTILHSSRFERSFKKLPENLKDIAVEKEDIFRKNPFDRRLNTHKLHGKQANYWTFSVNREYRIIFEFVDAEVIWFHVVGNHDIYE